MSAEFAIGFFAVVSSFVSGGAYLLLANAWGFYPFHSDPPIEAVTPEVATLRDIARLSKTYLDGVNACEAYGRDPEASVDGPACDCDENERALSEAIARLEEIRRGG
jgi:hypothetical protein